MIKLIHYFRTKGLIISLLGLTFGLSLTLPEIYGATNPSEATLFPIDFNAYQDSNLSKISDVLLYRIAYDPFNLVVSVIFLLAIIHTFLAGKIHRFAVALEGKTLQRIRNLKREGKIEQDYPEHSHRASLLLFLGEVEIVLTLWVVVLGIMFTVLKGWDVFLNYIEHQVVFTEPLFVVVIMTIASTRPVMYSAEITINVVAKYLRGILRTYSGASWFVILFVGSLLGSVITEVASVTICALLLVENIFKHTDNTKFKYCTMGILLVNISIGGALTHFAAPVVFIVAEKWQLTTPFMLETFGYKIILATFLSTLLGFLLFFKEFYKIDQQVAAKAAMETVKSNRIPWWTITIHYLFIIWSVFNAHHTTLVIGGYLFLLGFVVATRPYQKPVDLRTPLLIGLFLSGLLIHGGLQGWWIVPLLSGLSDNQLFGVAALLSVFNDNAGVTFLSSLIPDISAPAQYAILSGALAAGGLSILANAPNPTAFLILRPHFKGGISHLWLAVAALVPTLITFFFFFGLKPG